MFEDWARRKRELKALRADIKAQKREFKLLKSRAAPARREIKELAAGINRLLAEDGAKKKNAARAACEPRPAAEVYGIIMGPL